MCSTSLEVREMHMKTTVRYHLHKLLQWRILKRLTISNVGKQVKQLKLFNCWWADKNSTTLQSVWYLFVKHHVIHQFHYVFFQPWETKCLYKDLQMNGYSSFDHFSLKCQMSSMSINRWINKLQNIQVIEFNSEIKRITDV